MYKIFISYTNRGSDMEIAEQLFKELNKAPFNVFWDKDGLMAGHDYNAALNRNLLNSDFLVVLWSKNVLQSQWVHNEIAIFRAQSQNKVVIPVVLDIDWGLGTEQSINYLKDAGVYTNGMGTATFAQIVSVANKIRRSILTQNDCLPIKRVVLTLTDTRASQIATAANSYQKTDNYGDNFSDWTPFDSSLTIMQLLDRFLYTEVNGQAGATNPPFVWDDISWQIDREGIWQQDLRSALNQFSAEGDSFRYDRCVMIFDPFALNDPDVKRCFDWCWTKCQLNPKALVMSLTYSLKTHFEPIKDFLSWNLQPFYDHYLRPPIINQAVIENSFAHVIDNLEMERQLSILLRKQQIEGRTGSAFTTL